MALSPEQEATINALRAKYGMAPRYTQKLPVGAMPNTSGPKVGIGDVIAPPGKHFKQVGNTVNSAVDPAGLFGKGPKDLGSLAKNGLRSALDPAGLFGGGGPKAVKGQIDPITGTVTVSNYGKHKEALSNAFTNYLRTGQVGELTGGHGAYKKLKRQIADLRGTGWTYNPQGASAAPAVAPQRPVANPMANGVLGLIGAGGGVPSTQINPAAGSAAQQMLQQRAMAAPQAAAPQAAAPQAQVASGAGWRGGMGRIPGYADGGKVFDRKPNGKAR